MKTTTGSSCECRVRLEFLQQLEAAHVGQAQGRARRNRTASIVQDLERLAAGRHRRQFDVFVVQELDDRLPLDVVVLDDQKSLGARGREVPQAIEAVSMPSVVGDLTRYEKRAVGECRLPLVVAA